LTSTERLLLLGHRGARLPQIPENTFAAFDLALQAGCDGFEFDVRCTRDRQLVVLHDPKLRGLGVGASACAELRQRWQEKVVPRLPPPPSSAHQEPAPPCLPDVLQRYRGRAFLDIELKVAGVEEGVLRALREHPPAAFVVSSFLPQVLRDLGERDDRIPLGLICENTRQLALWPHLPVSFVIPHFKLASRELVEELHAAGKKVMVWTVNREPEMRRMAELGVDGIVSDDPARLAKAISG
jgi:glycerophosphoryl diester phosphodiesterase